MTTLTCFDLFTDLSLQKKIKAEQLYNNKKLFMNCK